MWLVAGLGNPGEQYAKTRHNLGFRVVDAIAEKNNLSFQRAFNAEVAKTVFEDETIILLKPQTYMNLSGDSLQPASQFYKITPKKVMVVYDEIDLPLGVVRIKDEGGHGGHNGIRDIIRTIGSSFIRVRVGVGRPQIKGTEKDFLLKAFRKEELQIVEEEIVTAYEAVFAIVRDGVKKAQMTYNQKKSPLANKA